MGLFDFVENFFFIGLALLFVLVLLLVYHFKQRMNSVEKKGDNMFDLLTNVVRELRNIRTNIGGGGSTVEQVVPPSIQSYSMANAISEEETDSDYQSDDSETGSEYSNYEENDGITYQIIDAKEKVVVSDESDSGSGSGSGSDTEEEEEDDEESLLDQDIEDIQDTQEMAAVEPVSTIENIPVSLEYDEEVPLDIDAEEICEIPIVAHEKEEVDDMNVSTTTATDDIQPITRVVGGANQEKLNSYKKMNVNQLKALAIQAGIQGDTSKLKKTALIELLLEKQA